MGEADGHETEQRLAAAVLAGAPSALLPAALAQLDGVRPDAGALRLALTIDGRAYRYRWPEQGTVAQAVDATRRQDPAAWATTVLANLAETLEAEDRGLEWALAHGVIRPG